MNRAQLEDRMARILGWMRFDEVHDDLRTEGRNCLNEALRHIYREREWPWALVSGTFSLTAGTYDYYPFSNLDPGQGLQQIRHAGRDNTNVTLIRHEDWTRLIVDTNTGTPDFAAVGPGSATGDAVPGIFFYRSPSSGWAVSAWYWRQPTVFSGALTASGAAADIPARYEGALISLATVFWGEVALPPKERQQILDRQMAMYAKHLSQMKRDAWQPGVSESARRFDNVAAELRTTPQWA